MGLIYLYLKKEGELLSDTFGYRKSVSGAMGVQNIIWKDTPNDNLVPCGMQLESDLTTADFLRCLTAKSPCRSASGDESDLKGVKGVEMRRCRLSVLLGRLFSVWTENMFHSRSLFRHFHWILSICQGCARTDLRTSYYPVTVRRTHNNFRPKRVQTPCSVRTFKPNEPATKLHGAESPTSW